jgi:two-component system, CitB family, sensor kinase
MPRIFGDGFTTKPQSQSRPRGLGLALVHASVSRLGGSVDVSTPEGGGARFTVTVPRTDPLPPLAPAPRVAAR